MAEKHSSPAIMYAVILVSIVLVAIIVPFAMKGKGGAGAGGSDEEADSRIAPVARVEIESASAQKASGPRDGKTVYTNICAACHGSGALNAPKFGDKAAWGPRIAQGAATLFDHASKGFKAMPARGGAADLSDDELKAAIEHMVGAAK